MWLLKTGDPLILGGHISRFDCTMCIHVPAKILKQWVRAPSQRGAGVQ